MKLGRQIIGKKCDNKGYFNVGLLLVPALSLGQFRSKPKTVLFVQRYG